MRKIKAPLFSILLIVAAGASVGCGGSAPTAETPLRGAGADHALPTDDPIAHALAARLTIWVSRDGDVVYARHCRDAPGGCEARIASFTSLISQSAERHALDPWLLAAVAVRESMLNPAAIGARGEAGIVQLHPRGAGHDMRYVQDSDFRERCLGTVDACQGPVVERGAQHLAEAIESCGGVREGLGKYASGRCGAAGAYVDRIWDERERLSEQGP